MYEIHLGRVYSVLSEKSHPWRWLWPKDNIYHEPFPIKEWTKWEQENNTPSSNCAQVFLVFWVFCFFWLHHMACGILVSQSEVLQTVTISQWILSNTHWIHNNVAEVCYKPDRFQRTFLDLYSTGDQVPKDCIFKYNPIGLVPGVVWGQT